MWRLLSLSYLWGIAISLAPLGIAWYVLWRLTDRTDVLIVSLAGVLYVIITLAWTSYGSQISELREEIAHTRFMVRSLVDPSHKDNFIESLKGEDRRRERDTRRAYLDSFSMLVSVITLVVCLVRLFAVI